MAGALSLSGLTKRFGDEVAVDGIDLEIGEGEFFSLLGASGCGKTTTLRMIAGFEKPDAGSIHLDGRDLSLVPPHRRPVNTVFQSYGLFPFLSVSDNVAFGLRYTDATPEATRRRVAAALELVQLGSFAKRKPHQLSGGQRQRVALARALVLEPTVLLLDEPMGALDAKLRRQLQVELRSLQRTVGTTFVYVTHDQEEALTMSDRLAIMVDGRVEQVGTPSEMYAAPATAYVAGFLGSANLLQGRVVDALPGLVGCDVDGLHLVAHAAYPAAVGDPVTLLLRPERIEVGPTTEMPSEAGTNVFDARIEHIVFRGGHTHVTVRAATSTLTAEVANVHGELPDWVGEGRDVRVRVSHRAVQLLPTSERPGATWTATDADAPSAEAAHP